MSTRQIGNRSENAVASELEALGYVCFTSRGSRGIDLFAVNAENNGPHLAIEVGGAGKVVAGSFVKLRANVVPAGTRFLVVCRRKMSNGRRVWRWYVDGSKPLATAAAALAALREAA